MGSAFLRVLPVFLVLVLVLPDALANAGGLRDVSSGSVQGALDRVTVQTAEGLHVFRVELADEPHERSRGLMFRKSLPDDGGMLFDNGEVKMMAMWMKNTFISLDMIFISNEGLIVTIVEDTTPFSTDTISSGHPVRAVLEVKGGTAERLGIRPGDRVAHPIFAQPSE